MNIVQKIEAIAKKRGISINHIECSAGLSRGIIRSWEHKQPTADKIVRLADFLDVSVDYLLGRTSVQSNSIENDEDILCLQRARSRMSDEDKEKAMQLWRVAFSYAFDEEKVDK